MLPNLLTDALSRVSKLNLGVIMLTGAGISAKSGIPTFSGAEGYWNIGSEEYFPEEMAT